MYCTFPLLISDIIPFTHNWISKRWMNFEKAIRRRNGLFLIFFRTNWNKMWLSTAHNVKYMSVYSGKNIRNILKRKYTESYMIGLLTEWIADRTPMIPCVTPSASSPFTRTSVVRGNRMLVLVLRAADVSSITVSSVALPVTSQIKSSRINWEYLQQPIKCSQVFG